YAEAIALAEEVLSASASNQYGRQWAYDTLAYIRLSMGEYEEALSIAQQSLLLAQAMENPQSVTNTHQLLGRIYRETGQLAQATQAVAQEWCWARRCGNVASCSNALKNCARVRNLQARVTCGLPATWDPFPEQIPAEVQVPLALRRVQSAR